MLRLLPGMTVLAPADALEVRALLKASLRHDGPVYMRIGKKNEPLVHEEEPALEIGRAVTMREGRGVCLLNTGTTLPRVLEAADLLKADGIEAEVLHFPTVKPLDVEALERASTTCSLFVSVEEHSVIGGFGGSIAEWLGGRAEYRPRLERVGAADEFIHETCEQETAMEKFGLTAKAIAERVKTAV